MYRQARLIFRQQNLSFYIGFITILEFESIIGRMWINRQIRFEQDIEKRIISLSESDQIKALTEVCFNILPIKIIPFSALEKIIFNDIEYLVENTFALAYRVCPLVHLRTLDVIQIATALKIKYLSGFNVQYFLTNDHNILNNGQEIHNKLQIIPISCSELLSVLKVPL